MGNYSNFFAVPLMHVLAIHMKVMAPRQQLSDEWAALTGLWLTSDNQGKLMLKDNKVPLLLQDPLALMIHYILLLPVNIDLGESLFKLFIQPLIYNLSVFR
jgi:hypothetical protein